MRLPTRRFARPTLALVLGLVLVRFPGCSEPPTTDYSAPLRSAEAVRVELAAACRRAVEQDAPVLIEFSAPWCSDCQRLHGMKQASALARELKAWPNVTINVGRFDQHVDLLEHFEIEKIANWSIFTPKDCSRPVETWPRRVTRTLEPSSGAERDTSPAELARWLREIRTS